MVYLNILLGLGVVLVSAAAAIYFSQPSYQQTPPYRHRRRNDEEDDAGSFCSDTKKRRNLGQQQMRGSKPGDKCSVCLDEMAVENIHKMECGHALHNECFEEYRYLRRNCPLCSQTVNPSLPGDNCTICLDPLNRNDMVFLRCQHAMHQLCYEQFIDSGAKVCSLCRKGL
ncbi:uncharacterized protein [Drosophila kikkawai]|uniref:RING-type domain-containing protein n=1 Tax=Drosophila kikkawai TaxID=30033 RepID=A0A6P4JPP1_DROKI|nr:uncharacterized protein LOC108084892 [Drosophila kikkawai]KAH8343730.1 hypothetical protein KR059_006468 [Drosophila kikkawai]